MSNQILSQQNSTSNTPPPTMTDLMADRFRQAFMTADPPKPKQPNFITRILDRLGRREGVK